MDSLKQYFEIQREDNELLKQEIVKTLENLISPLDIPPSSSDRSPTKYCNYITALCHFEQKINHKLTEINFELKKFILKNKRPEAGPPPIKKEELDDSFDDIETLKANSSKLILKLDKLRDTQCHEIDSNQVVKIHSVDDAKVCLENIQETCYQQEGPLICLDSSFSEDQDENVKTESKCNELVQNVDNKGLTCEEINVTENKDNFDHLENKEQEIESVIRKLTKEEVDELENEHFQFKTLQESSISVIIEKTDKNLMDTITNFELSSSDEAVLDTKTVPISFNQKDSISEVMLKNLMELSSPKHFPNSEIIDDIFGFTHRDETQSQEIKCEVNEIDSKEKVLSMLRPDMSDMSSYYDSESDFGSSLSEKLLEGIPKLKLKNSNKCDSSKENSLKEHSRQVDETDCEIEEIKEENVPDTSKLEASFQGGLDEKQEEKIEEISVKNEEPKSLPVPEQPATEKECPKPVFSAEEKIKKLGLEDRRTLFEKTKKVAVLPDLRLRPSGTSATDAEKLKQKQAKKLEIPDNDAPSVNTCCVFSHVESPSEFYVHPDTEESKLIDNLNDLITEEYKKTKSMYDSKYDAYKDIGKYCCAYVKEDKMYYRAEIVDWLLDESNKLVWIRLVDYGNSLHVHFKNLRSLTEQFCLLPKLAIKCYLPFLYPPGSTKNELLTEWPSESTEALFELTGLSVENSNDLFRIVYVEKDGNYTGIDLYQVHGKQETIGQLLIDLGHAVQVVSLKDDPMGILTDEEDIETLEQCNNINEVILGYDPKDEARICKFTKPDGGKCFKKNCKLEHTKFARGGFTTDQTLTYVEALSDLSLPKPKDFTAIRFTTFVSSTCFYVNIVRYVSNLRDLEYTMNNPANYSTFERYKILPAHGEVVLVKHWQKRWMRAKVRHHLFSEDGKCTGVQVFMVDFGDIIDASLDNIRHIKREYLNLPFQAIECMLSNYEDSGEYAFKDMDRFFYENMVYRDFSAKVLAISDMHMCAEVYFKNRNLGDILVDYGFLKKVNSKSIFPHPNSVIIPG